MSADPALVLGASAVARRLGVAVPTLRSWDRRYALGPSDHAPGRHRRYTGADLARLQRLVQLVEQGVPTAEAARLITGSLPVTGRRGGGRRTVALPGAGDEVRGLAAAAARLDPVAVRHRVERLLRTAGVVPTWESVLVPLLRGIGERYTRQLDTIEIEHAASAGILAALHSVRPQIAARTLPVLLACAPAEQHTLPLEALCAALAERGRACRFLGANVPADALLRAAGRLRPAAVLVWAGTNQGAAAARVGALLPVADAVLLGGAGWAGTTPPAGVEVIDSLTAALHATDRVLPA